MIAAALQRLISQRHLNVPEIAEAAGLDDSTLYKWAAGQTRPSFDGIARIMRAAHQTPNASASAGVIEAELLRCFIGDRRLTAVALDETPPRGEFVGRAISQLIAATSSLEHLRTAPHPRAYATHHAEAQRDVELALRALGHVRQFLVDHPPHTSGGANGHANRGKAQKRRDP